MAISFDKLEAVGFGDFEVMPQMDKEQQLRVKALEIKDNNLDEAIEVLSACFGAENTAKIKEFMQKNMFQMDMIKLRTYLTQGNEGVKSLQSRMDRIIDKKMDEALAAMEELATTGDVKSE